MTSQMFTKDIETIKAMINKMQEDDCVVINNVSITAKWQGYACVNKITNKVCCGSLTDVIEFLTK